MHRYAGLILTVSLSLTACDKLTAPDSYFTVKAVDENMRPIAGAIIEAGFDWEYFKGPTDSEGRARVPSIVNGKNASISKNNRFTFITEDFRSGTYVLGSTPKMFEAIGPVEGRVAGFMDDLIITVDYFGVYREYQYSDNTVTLLNTRQLTTYIDEVRIIQETLICRTRYNGLYLYSLTDYSLPTEMQNLATDVEIAAFGLKDTLLFVAGRDTSGGFKLNIYSIEADPESSLVNQIEFPLVFDLYFKDDYLIAAGRYDFHFNVYDISDINAINLIYSDELDGYRDAIFRGNDFVLIPEYSADNQKYNYALVDISNPINPVYDFNYLTGEGVLQDIVDDDIAVGIYAGASHSLTVFEIDSGHLQVRAIHSESYAYEFAGYSPPYYIFADTLYKVVEY